MCEWNKKNNLLIWPVKGKEQIKKNHINSCIAAGILQPDEKYKAKWKSQTQRRGLSVKGSEKPFALAVMSVDQHLWDVETKLKRCVHTQIFKRACFFTDRLSDSFLIKFGLEEIQMSFC